MTAGPLAGVRVIELGTVIAGPFAGSLLSELGAEVIKIEPPGAGDVLRRMGPIKNGVPLWWGVSSRGKKCITLNLKAPQGQEMFKQLVSTADVLVQNYRPGMLAKMGLDWPVLREVNPNLVMLSISGFGGTGPYKARPGFGKIAEGVSGLVNLTGSASDRPLFIGFSLADTSTGLFGVLGVMIALFKRDVGKGGGALVDIALYEGLLRTMECQFVAVGPGTAGVQRRGTNDPYQWGIADKREERFAFVKSSADQWYFLMFPSADVEASVRARVDAAGAEDDDEGALTARLTDWASTRSPQEMLGMLRAAGVEIAPVHDGATMAQDPYFQDRGHVVPVAHPPAGDLNVPGFLGSGTPSFRPAGVGEDNEDVYSRWLGLSAERVTDLRKEGVL